MTSSDTSLTPSASELITEKIASLVGWRGETLARMRKLIFEGDAVDAAAVKALIHEAVALNGTPKTKPVNKSKVV